MEKIFFYDLETTGTKHWKNGVHQISGALVINGEVKEEFNYRVRPNPAAAIEPEALAIGGVTIEQITEYPPMIDVYHKIEAMLGLYCGKFDKTDKFHLAGFNNAGFDNAFFRAFFVQNAPNKKAADYGNYFGSWFWSDTIDVMVLASQYLRKERHKMENFKLATVAAYLGVQVDESKLHDALYDIYLTREIYKKVTE